MRDRIADTIRVWGEDNLEKHVAEIWARVQKARAERGED